MDAFRAEEVPLTRLTSMELTGSQGRRSNHERRIAVHGPSALRRVLAVGGAWLRVSAGAAGILAASAISRHARARLLGLARALGHHAQLGPELCLPVVPESHFADEATPIVIREASARDGNVTLRELLVLNRVVAARRPRQVFEIGTFDFRTTINLAANAPGARVFTLDLPAGGAHAALPLAEHDPKYIGVGASVARRPSPTERDRITVLHGDSATFDFSPFTGSMDVVFVDGAHSFEYVCRDSATALALAAPGALIVWHDYGEWPGVTGALNQLFMDDPRFADLRHVTGTTLAVLDLGAATTA